MRFSLHIMALHMKISLYTQNMSFYFKQTISAILHCTNLNYILLKSSTLRLILSLLTRKDFVFLLFAKLVIQFKEIKF